MQTVTFNKVFKAEGSSQRGPWVRWDYKTEDGGRFPHFAATQEIPLDTPVVVQTSAKGDIKSWNPALAVVPAGEQQTSPGSSGLVSHVRTAPGTSSEASPDWDAIGRGKTRCLLAANLLPAMFSALPKAEQTPEGAEVLLGWAFDYVYSES